MDAHNHSAVAKWLAVIAATACFLAWLPAANAEAALSETPLAGYSAATWQKWGTALLLLQAFLEAEQAALGGETMRTVLMRRYVAVAQ